MTVYLDVLIVLNIYVNYFLIKATSKLTHSEIKKGQYIAASVIGSLFSLIILLPPMNFVLICFIKFGAAAIIVLISYWKVTLKRYIKLLIFFYGVNFIFAGTGLYIYEFLNPSFIEFNNSYFYIDFSLITLVIATIIAYLAISLVRYICDKRGTIDVKYRIMVFYNGRTASFEGFADTGNSLRDMFTGKQVIICNAENLNLPDEIKEILKEEDEIKKRELMIKQKEIKGLRLIPYRTVSGLSEIAVFEPDKVIIKNAENKDFKEVNALIGINNESKISMESIFNPSIFV